METHHNNTHDTDTLYHHYYTACYMPSDKEMLALILDDTPVSNHTTSRGKHNQWDDDDMKIVLAIHNTSSLIDKDSVVV